MRSTLILAVLAGVCVAVQTSLTGAAQRTLGPLVLVAISGLTTGVFALLMSLVVAKPEFTGRAVGYAVTSGILGAVIVGSIAVAAGQAGVARALSLVITAQLIAGLVLDALGVFGAGADFSILKALGVLLIIAGGVLVVSFRVFQLVSTAPLAPCQHASGLSKALAFSLSPKFCAKRAGSHSGGRQHNAGDLS
jgi:bacterial/archaeal transporter family-2 protein